MRRRWDDEVSGWLISDFPGGVSGFFLRLLLRVYYRVYRFLFVPSIMLKESSGRFLTVSNGEAGNGPEKPRGNSPRPETVSYEYPPIRRNI